VEIGHLPVPYPVDDRDLPREDQELTVGTAGDATTDEQRQAIADRFKLGLVRYLIGTPPA
jgi:hypothetical protein